MQDESRLPPSRSGAKSIVQDEVRYERLAHEPGIVLGHAQFLHTSFKRHFHLDYHIGIMPSGVERVGYAGSSVLLGPGLVSIIPPDEIHDGMAAPGQTPLRTLKTFRIAPELIATAAAEISGRQTMPLIRPILVADARWAAELVYMHAHLLKRPNTSRLAQDTHFLRLLQRILQSGNALPSATASTGLSLQARQRVLDYCVANLAENINLQQLAQLCDLNRFQFLRSFNKTVGLTPHAWLLRLRLEHACALLSKGKYSIADVAAQVGFYDQSHFNRAFRTAYQVNPSSY